MKDLMHYKNYYGSVHFDSEDVVLHGKVEFVKALITYEATDAVGLVKAFRESIDEYLDMCEHDHIKPEASFKGSLNVRIGEALHRRLAIAAMQQDSSINNFIARTLDEALSENVGSEKKKHKETLFAKNSAR